MNSGGHIGTIAFGESSSSIIGQEFTKLAIMAKRLSKNFYAVDVFYASHFHAKGCCATGC